MINHIRKNIKTKSITLKIIISFLSIILAITVVVSAFSYVIALRFLSQSSADYTRELIAQVNEGIQSYITYMENVSDFVAVNPDVLDYLSLQTFSSPEAQKNYEKKIAVQLDGILRARKDISNIIIFRNDGNAVLNKEYLHLNPYSDYRSSGWYQNALAAGGGSVLASSHVQNVVKDDYRWVTSLSRAILDDSGSAIGVLLIDLNYSVIDNLCKNIVLGSRGYVFILDANGDIIYHPRQQLIYNRLQTENIAGILSFGDGIFRQTKEFSRKSYVIQVSAGTGWRIVGVTYPSEAIPQRNGILLFYLATGVLFSLIAISIAVAISKRLSSPIKKLESCVKRVENGEFDIHLEIESNDEIGQIGKGLNLVLEKMRNLTSQSIKNEEIKRKSELKALQSQINPHFLYNTLDSIIWMAETGKSDEVVEMTAALADLFRTSISKTDDLIPLQNEIENIRSYLTIQKMRYQDMLNFEVTVPNELMDCQVIKLLLQPLVENAIYHGIKYKDAPGIVTVSGSEKEGQLILTVEDDGTGMDEQALRDILVREPGKRSGGVGVNNVNTRIKLYFGAEYGLHYDSSPGKGTKVTIVLPILREGTGDFE